MNDCSADNRQNSVLVFVSSSLSTKRDICNLSGPLPDRGASLSPAVCSIWSVRRPAVLTLSSGFRSRVDQSGPAIGVEVVSAGGGVTSRPLTVTCVIHHCQVGPPFQGGAAGRQRGPQGSTRQRAFEVSCKYCVYASKAPSTSHMDTSRNDPWEPVTRERLEQHRGRPIGPHGKRA